jgi:hypothetical protein
MLATVGLLIAPSTFHRIVDRGESTGRTQTITSVCAALALVPFATALGLDLSIALSRTLQSAIGGILAGAGFALVSGSAWFGMGWIMKLHDGGKERQKAEAEREARETALQDRADADGSARDPTGRPGTVRIPVGDSAD